MRHRLLTTAVALCLAAGLTAAQPARVTIDVKPGDNPTTIEPGREGMMPIAVFSTAAVDVATIDAHSITVGPTGAEASPVRVIVDDIDKDGRQDLMVLVRVQELGLKCGDTQIQLKARTTAGISVEGAEKIETIGC